MDAIVVRQDNHHKTLQTERLHEKVGTYVTNTGLMATYGGQFTLTMYLASEALCRVLACPVLVRTRHRWSAGSYCTRADTAWCYVRAALFT